MQPWFRFYDDAVTDPKVQLLPENLFKFWVNILCLANKNNGTLPKSNHIAYALHVTEGAVVTCVTQLSEAGLLDRLNATTWAPHNWSGRQFKSDSSAERMRRHRERHKDRHDNVMVTPPEREKERETEEEISRREISSSLEREKEDAAPALSRSDAPSASAASKQKTNGHFQHLTSEDFKSGTDIAKALQGAFSTTEQVRTTAQTNLIKRYYEILDHGT